MFYRLGETMPAKKVLERQQQTDELYLPRYFDIDQEYKLAGGIERKAEMVVFGSSRMFPIVGEIVHNSSFYNFSIPSSHNRGVKQIIQILRILEKNNALPLEIIWGIDSWVFNPDHANNQRSLADRILEKVGGNIFYKIYRFVKLRCNAYSLMAKEQKNVLKYILFPEKFSGIGLNAKLVHSGFRADGSVFYIDKYAEVKVRTQEQWEQFLSGKYYTNSNSDQLDQGALDELDALLKFCQKHNIKITGLLLPFRPDLYDAIIKSKNRGAYLQKFCDEVPTIFATNGFIAYDFSSPDKFNLKIEDFRDPTHPLFYVYSQMLKMTVKNFAY